MENMIEITNVSKKYKIKHWQGRYVALRDVIANIFTHPFRYAKEKTKEIAGIGGSEEFWALKDINLKVKKGEVVGIIGKNGAGKSTLFKILTGITPPTSGEIKIKGRVVSLLEVGTGFHPELTGRENIFLNGAILGMTRREIQQKFDQIVEFSGIKKFIDTPVKRYSSGMYVRLAFSVAAHLEPDILLVDEVLAVGDAEFQKKCLGKMDEVTKTAGRTILFVSHNMDAINRLCKTAVLLDNGRIAAHGSTESVINTYFNTRQETEKEIPFPISDRDVTLHDFSISQNNKETAEIAGEKPFAITVDFAVNKKLPSFRVGVFIKNSMDAVVTRSFVQDREPELEEISPGRYHTSLEIPSHLFREGQYDIELKIFQTGIDSYFENRSLTKNINIFSPKDFNELQSKNTDTRGHFLIPGQWQTKNINS